MPITQDRFLEILDAANALVELAHAVRRLARQDIQLISDANVVMARTNDSAAREVVGNFLASFNTIQSTLTENEETISVLGAKVQAEQQYFKRVGRSNERAAFYQKRKRSLIRDGHEAIYVQAKADRATREQELYPNSPASAATNSSNEPIKVESVAERFARLDREETENKLEQARAIARAPGQAAKATSSPEPISTRPHNKHIPTKAGIGYEKDIVSTSVPSLDELNKIGISTPEEDVL